MNIHEVTANYDALITEQKQTLKTMDKLITLSEKLIYELQIRNGGLTNASN